MHGLQQVARIILLMKLINVERPLWAFVCSHRCGKHDHFYAPLDVANPCELFSHVRQLKDQSRSPNNHLIVGDHTFSGP